MRYLTILSDYAGRTPLHCAITSDATRVFHVLLKNRQTNINERAHDGTTPMILAVKMETEGMVEELIQNKVRVVSHISLAYITRLKLVRVSGSKSQAISLGNTSPDQCLSIIYKVMGLKISAYLTWHFLNFCNRVVNYLIGLCARDIIHTCMRFCLASVI